MGVCRFQKNPEGKQSEEPAAKVKSPTGPRFCLDSAMLCGCCLSSSGERSAEMSLWCRNVGFKLVQNPKSRCSWKLASPPGSTCWANSWKREFAAFMHPTQRWWGGRGTCSNSWASNPPHRQQTLFVCCFFDVSLPLMTFLLHTVYHTDPRNTKVVGVHCRDITHTTYLLCSTQICELAKCLQANLTLNLCEGGGCNS